VKQIGWRGTGKKGMKKVKYVQVNQNVMSLKKKVKIKTGDGLINRGYQ